MRCCYVAVAVAVTLLASTTAVSTDAGNQISQTTPEIIAATQIDSPVKRSLRAQKPTHDEEVPLDALDDTEERGKGVNAQQIRKIIQAKRVKIPTNIDNLTNKAKKALVYKFVSQNLTKKKFATKLGMRDVDDMTNRHYAFFKQWEHLFLPGKKPKKVPEAMIGNHEYYL